jgi:hypothetical protein
MNYIYERTGVRIYFCFVHLIVRDSPAHTDPPFFVQINGKQGRSFGETMKR